MAPSDAVYRAGPPRPHLVRAIGRWDLTGSVINGAVGASIFGMPAVLAGLTGIWSPAVYVLGERVPARGTKAAALRRETALDLVRSSHEMARLAEADARRWNETRRRERWRTVVSVLAMLLGGFLAGQVASYRSGGTANAKPAATEEKGSITKSAPSARRRPAGLTTKPHVAPAR